jgi:hypothetical protein
VEKKEKFLVSPSGEKWRWILLDTFFHCDIYNVKHCQKKDKPAGSQKKN